MKGAGSSVGDLHVSQVVVYPVKSLAGCQLHEGELVQTGLCHDRAWMIIDDSGVFVTQRQHPSMARIRAKAAEDCLTLYVPDGDTIRVPIVAQGDVVDVRVWGHDCRALDQGEAAAQLLSSYLHRSCRLVRMAGEFLCYVETP